MSSGASLTGILTLTLGLTLDHTSTSGTVADFTAFQLGLGLEIAAGSFVARRMGHNA